MQAGRVWAQGLPERLARRLLRPLVSRLAATLLRVARSLDGGDDAGAAARSPAQKDLTREVLLLRGWSNALQEADLPQFAGELAKSGLRRRVLQQADMAVLAAELAEAGLLERFAQEADLQQFTRDLAQSGLLRRVLQVGDVPLLARELGDSALLARMSPELRVQLLPAIVRASAALQARWADLDAVLNFSAHMRNAWVARQAALLPAGARVLDAGAGEGQYRPLFTHTKYAAQDFAQYGGSCDANAPESWRYSKLDYVCDITAIPAPDASFDAVVCTEVLEHVPDPLAALRELARITAPGGRMLLSAPLGSGMHQEPFHFYGGFSRHFWERLLPELGFEIDEIVPLRGLMSHVAQEVHRAARYMAVQGRLTPEQSWVMQEWLPRVLHEEDDAVPVEQFTVGYVVRASKRKEGAR